MLELTVATFTLFSLILYALTGGADFGGGMWDLLASGPRAARQREVIAEAIGPIWEANHVWLIFLIVVLFAGFPAAFAALSIGLFVPFHVALVGITLRGSAFVFRAYGPQRLAARWGAVFGVASVVTPFLLGASLGAVSAGGLRVLAPISLTMGAIALAVSSYLAAVFLTNETEGSLREDFRRRALVSGGVVVALAIVALPLARADAPHLTDSLLTLRAAPVILAGALASLVSLAMLLARRYRSARVSAIAQVTLLLLGWGLAQYPYIVYPSITLFSAAAPPSTLRFLLGSLPFGAALLGPSLWLLFRVFKPSKAEPHP